MSSRFIHHQPRLVVFFILALVLLVPIAACGAAPKQSSSPGAYQPVTVQSCGQKLTFTKAPTRVISTWQMTTDILLDLGLGDRIVGVYAKALYQPEPRFQAQYARLHDLGGNTTQVPSKELALSTHPDFVFSAYPPVDFVASAGVASQEQFKAQGAQIYGMSGECSGDATHARVTSAYDDILNIGRIFGVQARAQHVVNAMKQHVASVQKRVASLPPTKVIALQNISTPQATAPVTVIGGGIYTDMLSLAGGTNLFGTQNQTYPAISREFFAVQKPEAYVVINYVGSNSSAFSSYLFSTYPNNPASKQHRVIDIDGDQWYEGISFPDTVEKLARLFHPEAFQ